MRTESITTHDIRIGDRIANHGMILRVDDEPAVSKGHPDGRGGACIWVRAVVENFTEVKASAEAGSDTARFLLSFIESDMSPHGYRARNGQTPDVEPHWTIQGNGLARWARIIEGE